MKAFLTLVFVFSFLTACSKSSNQGQNGELAEGSLVNENDITTDNKRFGEGNIPYASEGSLFPDVFFDYDSSAVRQDDIASLRQTAKKLSGDASLRAEVEGHCDKRGTAEYNMALGEERAKSVAALLVSYGVRPEQLTTISYGEEIPVDPADSETAYAKNRRVHFAVYRKN